MTPRRASIAALVAACVALLYLPVFFGSLLVPGVLDAIGGRIEGNVERSLVVVPAIGAAVGLALAGRANTADALLADRRRARQAKIVARLALVQALFWVCIVFVGGALAIR